MVDFEQSWILFVHWNNMSGHIFSFTLVTRAFYCLVGDTTPKPICGKKAFGNIAAKLNQVICVFPEELPQDEDDKETIPAISPVDERLHNFSYWVKNDDNYYNNKLSSTPNSKTVRFDEKKRGGVVVGVRKGQGHDPGGGDPSCYPLTAYEPTGDRGQGNKGQEGGEGGCVGREGYRKTMRYDTQDGILV